MPVRGGLPLSKGTRIYSLRIPPQLMSEVCTFVARNFDRHQKGELTVTTFILDSIRERLRKLERAKESGKRSADRKRGGVIHPVPEEPSQPVSSIADTELSAGFDGDAVAGQ